MRAPLPIDWNLAPDEQAWRYYRAIESEVYPAGAERPTWATAADFAESETQRQMGAVFDGGAYSWRRSGKPKVVHSIGAAGLFRLEIRGQGLGSVLDRGAGRMFIARYSLAIGRADDEPILLGVALKFPRERRPAVDILMLLVEQKVEELSRAWGRPFSTHVDDPRTAPGLSPKNRGFAIQGAEGLDAIARGMGASDDVRAHRMPLPAGIRAERLTWVHSRRAVNLLRTCGETPFDGQMMSPDDVPLVGKVRGEPWAHLYVGGPPEDSSAEPWADVFLETRLHVGPVADYWLHFTHPRGVHP